MLRFPSWLIVLIVVVVVFFIGNAIGLWHVHFNLSGSFGV